MPNKPWKNHSGASLRLRYLSFAAWFGSHSSLKLMEAWDEPKHGFPTMNNAVLLLRRFSTPLTYTLEHMDVIFLTQSLNTLLSLKPLQAGGLFKIISFHDLSLKATLFPPANPAALKLNLWIQVMPERFIAWHTVVIWSEHKYFSMHDILKQRVHVWTLWRYGPWLSYSLPKPQLLEHSLSMYICWMTKSTVCSG